MRKRGGRMADPRAMALGVVQRALERREGIELLVALQYVGALKDDALAALREADRADDVVGRILSVPPAPEPVRAKPSARQRHEVIRREHGLNVERPAASRRERRQREMFSEWMDGRAEWCPAVMGWADDDERAEGWQDGRYDR